MNYLIIAFAAVIAAAALWMLLRPSSFVDNMRRFAGQSWLHVLAVAVRLVLGTALLVYAERSRFPLTLQVLGGVAIAAAVTLVLITRARFTRLITWALDRFAGYLPAAALVTLLFAAFLFYAVS